MDGYLLRCMNGLQVALLWFVRPGKENSTSNNNVFNGERRCDVSRGITSNVIAQTHSLTPTHHPFPLLLAGGFWNSANRSPIFFKRFCLITGFCTVLFTVFAAFLFLSSTGFSTLTNLIS